MLASMDAVEGATVLDLFAGSGALGIEALSRGARSAVFVDDDRNALAAVEANLQVLGPVASRAAVRRGDAVVYARDAEPVDIVFADPPYAWEDWPALLSALTGRAGLVVAESDREQEGGPAWETVKIKRYGSTVVTVMQPAHPRSDQ